MDSPKRFFGRSLAAVMAVGSALLFFLALIGFWGYQRERIEVLGHEEEELASAALFRVEEVVAWRNERLADGRVLSQNPLFAEALQPVVARASGATLAPEVLSWLKGFMAAYGYLEVLVVDAEGKLLLSISEKEDPLRRHARDFALEAMRAGQPLLSNPHRSRSEDAPNLHLACPLWVTTATGSKSASAAVILTIGLDRPPFSTFGVWPLSSRSAECLLIHLDDDRLSILSQMRHEPDAELPFMIPMEQLDPALNGAVASAGRAFEMKDYRNELTLGVIAKIPDTTWSLLAKKDMAEVLAPVAERALFMAVVGTLLLMLVAVGVVGWNRHRRAKEFRGRYELERDRSMLHSRFEMLLQSANDALFLMDSRGRVIEANTKAVDMYGYTREELLSLRLDELRAKGSLPPLDEVQRQIEEQGHALVETTHRRKDGSTFPVEASANALFLDGQLHIQAVIRDVSERRKADAAIRDVYERMTALFSSARDAALIADVETGLIVDANRQAERLFKRSHAELLGRHLTAIYPPEETERYRQLFLDAMKTSGENLIECEVCTSDGERVPVEISSTVIATESGRVLMQGSFRDISERLRTTQSLVESSTTLRATLESTGDGILVVGACGKVQHYNQQFLEIWHIPQEVSDSKDDSKLLEVAVEQLVDPDAFLAKISQLYASDRTDTDIVHFKDGRIIERHSAPLVIDGKTTGRVWCFMDITRQRQTELDLRRLVAAINQVEESVVITDRTGTIEYVNPAFEKGSGYSAAEAIGSNPRFLKSGKQDDSFYEDMWQTILAGKSWIGHITNKRKDGRLYIEDATISPVFGADGEISHFVAVKRDITHELEMERRVRQAEKMEAIGQLAGGIAHDFNNILQVILASGEFLREDIPADSRGREDLGQILKAGKRGADLTRQLLAFSRRTDLTVSAFSVQPLVKEITRMLERTIPANITINFHFGGELPEVVADPTQVHQVLLNLCLNAKDAMPHGGELVLSAYPAALTGEDSLLYAEAAPGDYVVIEVADTGIGISEEDQTHIFEPFFTTKGPSHGTGLGLASVYGIVRQHGGFLTCESVVGKGTIFRVWLPAGKPAAAAGQEESAAADLPRGTERLLFAEDQEAIMSTSVRGLQGLGYQVIAARNGQEAWQAYNARADEIDLVILDMQMPEIDGEMCLNLIRSVNPSAKVIVASGFIDPDLGERLRDCGVLEILPKPYNLYSLARTVRAALDAE